MTTACVLRSGGDYGPEHVQWLARQVPGLVCLSDVPVPGVETIQLQYDWKGWWSKLEMFGPALAGDVLMLDLDTVVLQMPDLPTETTVLRDFTEPSVMGSGLMFVTAADRARVWEAWIADPVRHMRENNRWPKWGDQGFLQPLIGHCQKWQDVAQVYSYKVHCRGGLPEGAQVVCFHGKPRPWAVQEAWVPPLTSLRDFRELVLAHKGKRVIVMGGGASLAADLDVLGKQAGDVVISCNGHGVDLRKPNYLLAMDHTHTATGVPMLRHLRALYDAPVISPHACADYRLGHWPEAPRFVLSGLIAAWAGFAMGGKVVCLAGFDGYADNDYTDEARKIARDIHCPVRVVSGFLQGVWPAWNAAERFGRYTPHSSIDGLRGINNLVRVRARKPCRIGMVELERGQEMSVMRHDRDARLMLKHRMVEEV